MSRMVLKVTTEETESGEVHTMELACLEHTTQ